MANKNGLKKSIKKKLNFKLDADLVLEFVKSFGQASDKCYYVGLWPELIWSKNGVL